MIIGFRAQCPVYQYDSGPDGWQVLRVPIDVVVVEVQPLKDLQEVGQDDLAALRLGQLVQVRRQNHHVVFVFVPQLFDLVEELVQVVRKVG